jgi:hypothetical protein
LMTARDIDDRQTPVRQAHTIRDIEAFVIRAPMTQGIGHSLER